MSSASSGPAFKMAPTRNRPIADAVTHGTSRHLGPGTVPVGNSRTSDAMMPSIGSHSTVVNNAIAASTLVTGRPLEATDCRYSSDSPVRRNKAPTASSNQPIGFRRVRELRIAPTVE